MTRFFIRAGERMPAPPDDIYVHGDVTGECERAVVWLLGNTQQGSEGSAAAVAIRHAFQDGQGLELDRIRFAKGDITALPGVVSHEAAIAMAEAGLWALIAANRAGKLPGGVGISAKVVTFPGGS